MGASVSFHVPAQIVINKAVYWKRVLLLEGKRVAIYLEGSIMLGNNLWMEVELMGKNVKVILQIRKNHLTGVTGNESSCVVRVMQMRRMSVICCFHITQGIFTVASVALSNNRSCTVYARIKSK